MSTPPKFISPDTAVPKGEVSIDTSGTGTRLKEDQPAIRQYVKDEDTGKIYPADSEIGQRLQEFGAKSFMLDVSSQTRNLEPVKEMQQEIINFSKDVAFALNDLTIREQTGHEMVTERKDRTAFHKYLVNKYFSKVPGQEKAAKEKSLSQILTEMSGIGSTANMSKPDGIWGQRTAQALQNTYALARSMINLMQDMNFQTDQYKNELNKLDDLIIDPVYFKTKAPLSTDKQIENSKSITMILRNIRNIFDHFKNKVLEPHKQYINQSESMIDLRIDQQALSYEEEAFIKANGAREMAKINNISISLNDLTDLGALKQKLKMAGANIDDFNSLKEYLEKIKNSAMTETKINLGF